MSFSPQSRVWIYQSDRIFNNSEATQVKKHLEHFIDQWTAHGKQLQAKAMLIYNLFVVIVVDEATAGATGCSIDSSVREIKKLEQQFEVDLFNRFNVAYKFGDEIKVLNKEDFETLISARQVDENTIVFNNMVQTLQELETKWEVPMKDSWHKLVFAEHLA